MKIAVIGGGIAGLAAAWLLSRQHAVTLFERQAQPGFVASAAAVPHNGALLRVDVPLRVFYPGYYPTLTRLYAALGVATEPVDYATTLCGADGRAYFRWRNLRLGDRAWACVLPQDLAGATARRIVRGALRFARQVRHTPPQGQSVGDYTAGMDPAFVDGLLLPTLATIATCTTADARAYPASVVAGYLANGVARESVRRAVHGADDVAARLLAGVARVQCRAGVQGVRRRAGGVLVRREAGVEEAFDHAVLATQANQAAALWQDAAASEAAVLAAFAYRALEVVMHRDPALMPPRRADWSPVNAHVSPAHERPESTIWINRVQPNLRTAAPLFQTVMLQRQPRDDLVITRAHFERPLVDAASVRAQAALARLHAQPGRRVWLCGSYAQPGVPLLESAVRSAYAVVDAMAAANAGRVADSSA